jgi:hypothetical protein
MAKNAVPAFQMPPGVPGKRRHAIPEFDAVTLEPLCHPQRAGADLGVIGLMDRALDRTRNYGPVAMVDRGVVDDAVAQERPVLHEPEHGFPPGSRICCFCFVTPQRAATAAFPI